MRPTPDVVCLGETMAQAAPADGRGLEHSREIRLAVAGAESTVAQYLADLGHRAAWVSRVGDDPFGRRIVASVAARGVDVGGVRSDPGAPTGVYFKDPGPDGTRVHYYRRGSAASRMTPADADAIPFGPEGVRLLHLTGITPALSDGCAALVDRVMERAADAGSLVSFDVNHRPALWSSPVVAADTLLGLARRADVVLVGRDEGEALWGAATADALREVIAPRGVLVVKDGAVGATEFDGGAVEFVAAPAVDVVEPVGAGDAFAAGYLSGLLNGAAPRERLALGHLLAGRTLRSVEDYVPVDPMNSAHAKGV
ncbi:sugar kinase [Streptomyces sp. Q6]|uniref:Sugar kinase n=1 Tax=Streptomyces citrinus TaxID=3118173 RepID=A0ACD5AF20_9ACTN